MDIIYIRARVLGQAEMNMSPASPLFDHGQYLDINLLLAKIGIILLTSLGFVGIQTYNGCKCLARFLAHYNCLIGVGQYHTHNEITFIVP